MKLQLFPRYAAGKSKPLSMQVKNFLNAAAAILWASAMLFSVGEMLAQPAVNVDSLRKEVSSQSGVKKVDALNALARAYWRTMPDTALVYALQAQTLAESINYSRGLEKALNTIAYMYEVKGEYAKSLEVRLRDMELSRQIEDDTALAWCYHSMGNISNYQGDNDRALAWHLKALELREKIGDKRGKGWSLNNIAWVFENQNQLEKALEYREKAARVWLELQDNEGLAATMSYQADVYSRKGEYDHALAVAHQALALRQKEGIDLTYNQLQLGKLYIAAAKYDSAVKMLESALNSNEKRYFPRVYNALALVHLKKKNDNVGIMYAQRAIELAEQVKDTKALEEGFLTLSKLYEAKGNFANTHHFFKKYAALKDSLQSQAMQNQILSREVNYQIGLREKEIKQLRQEKDAQTMIRNQLVALILLVLIISALLYWRYRVSIQAKRILQEKNEELSVKNALIEMQHKRLETAFKNLKETQQQLVQQEKLAALGEMAAGISHEIRNPLNFISNFVALATEHCEQLVQLLNQETPSKERANQTIKSLRDKLERIEYHTVRALRIVRSILEHSRSSSGERIETDLNALLKEYVQLCYHSYKMKDLSFNVRLKYDFDETLPKVRIAPQDFSRVFLNIIQNAFYSVYEKKKMIADTEPSAEFIAEVTVATRNLPGKVRICIHDNGLGLPVHLKEKIFQSFFTTKSGTDGIGLGLSISRDIIQAYNGKIWVESQEGEYAEFIMELPESIITPDPTLKETEAQNVKA